MTRPHLQRGAAALAVSLVLLFATSIAVLYLNRSLIFEQKSAANQLRATTAHEVAEAGLEWAIGMLNSFSNITSQCVTGASTGDTFRIKYTQPNWTTTSDMAPLNDTFPGCKIKADGTLACHCPNSGNTATASGMGNTDELPSFSIAFQAVPTDVTNASCSPNPGASGCTTDPEAVRIIATGCTASATACTKNQATSSSGPDAVATVTAIVKLQPLLRAAPAAALTCGGNCNPRGAYKIINTDPSTNGVTINAGGSITVANSATVATLPGLPTTNSQVSGDSSLSSLASNDATCSNSSMFKAYFGMTIEEYAAADGVVTTIDCTTANTCGTLVDAAYAKGKRSFYFPSGFWRNNSSGDLGTANDPVTIVTPGEFNINGNISIYGLVFSNSATVDDLGTGTSNIYGGIVVCKDQQSNGSGMIRYDPDVLNRGRKNSGVAVKLAGSWTHACKLDGSSPPQLTCN